MSRLLSSRRSLLVAAGAFVCAACAGSKAPPAEGSARQAPRPVIDAAPVVEVPAVDAAAPDAALPEAAIVDWPIDWPDERTELMLAYRRRHSDPAATDLTIAPSVIVLHYTSGGSAKGTKRYFDRTRIEKGRTKLLRAGAVNVSSHFLVDRDGTIYRLQPETRMGRHAIGLNHVAIGVENVGDDDKYPLTEAQVAANVALVRHLAARFPIRVLVGHNESDRLESTPYFVEREPNYRDDKPDPGARFMSAVRAQLTDLSLDGPPAE